MNYERLLLEIMPGATPKAKYDNFVKLVNSVDRICYPRRGTKDDDMDIHGATELLRPFLDGVPVEDSMGTKLK